MKKAILLPVLLLAMLFVQAQDGTLDPTFANGGFVRLSQSTKSSGFTSDGKLVVLDVDAVGNSKLMRYNIDGTTDASYGSGGVIKNVGNSFGTKFTVLKNSGVLTVADVTDYSPTGRYGFDEFVLSLYSPNGSVREVARIGRFDYRVTPGLPTALAPFNYNDKSWFAYGNPYYTTIAGVLGGAPDLPFTGLTGTISFGNNPPIPYSITVSGDGKIYVGGTQTSNILIQRFLVIQRFNSNGVPDSTYGTNSVVASNLSAGISNLVVQNDGKLLGSFVNEDGSAGNKLIRFNVDGSIDATFGSNGVVTTAFSIGKMLLQTDGRIIVGGTLSGDFAIARYNGNGTLDPSFGRGGITTTDFGGTEGISDMAIVGNRLYAYGSGILAAYQIKVGCTPPTFKNDGTIALDASCGNNDGQISIIPTTGTAPFMYSIDGGLTYKTGANTGSGFTNLAPGTYNLRLKDANGCESSIVEVTIRSLYGGPTFTYKTSEATCGNKNGSITIVPISGAGTFMYSIDGGMTYVEGPATGYTFSNLAANTYYLKIKNAAGCESAIIYEAVKANFSNCSGTTDHASITAIQNAISPEAISLEAASAYPNPTKGQFKLQLKGFALQKAEVSIFNGEGKIVQKRQLNSAGTSTLDFDFTGRAKGMYYIKITSNSGTRTSKVLVQ